jgi:glycosyltransferase involved in cell wall biosynthesis
LQAAASGLPIVAANAGALPELVQPGHNGLLVPPNDPQKLGEALLRITSDPAYRAELGRGSLEMADGHSDKETVREVTALYQSLIAQAREGDEG